VDVDIGLGCVSTAEIWWHLGNWRPVLCNVFSVHGRPLGSNYMFTDDS